MSEREKLKVAVRDALMREDARAVGERAREEDSHLIVLPWEGEAVRARVRIIDLWNGWGVAGVVLLLSLGMRLSTVDIEPGVTRALIHGASFLMMMHGMHSVFVARLRDLALVRMLGDNSCTGRSGRIKDCQTVVLQFFEDRIRIYGKLGHFDLRRNSGFDLRFELTQEGMPGFKRANSTLYIDSGQTEAWISERDNGKMYQLAAKYGWLKDSGAG